MAKLTDTIILGDLVVTGKTRFKNDIVFETEVNSNFIPDVDSSYTLGSASKRFSYVYADNIDLTANIATAGNIEAGGYLITGGELRTDADELVVRKDENGSWVRVAGKGLNIGDFSSPSAGYGEIELGAYDFSILKDDGSTLFTIDNATNNVVITDGSLGVGNSTPLSALTGQGVVITNDDGAGTGRILLDVEDITSGYQTRLATNDVGLMLESSSQSRPIFLKTGSSLDSVFKLTTSGVTYNDYEIWHSNNDGAGSGLDADLLDGLNSDAFVAVSGDTMTGNLEIRGVNPSLVLYETDVGASVDFSRLVHSSGDLYIQSEGNVRITGWGGIDVTGLTVKHSGANRDILHTANISNTVNKAYVDALNVNADTLDGQHGAYYATAADYLPLTGGEISSSLGIQVASPTAYSYNSNSHFAVGGPGIHASIAIVSDSTGTGGVAFADGTTGTERYAGLIQYNHSNNTMQYYINGSVTATMSYQALNLTGTMTATTFSGSGASLTNLPWASLTGVPSLYATSDFNTDLAASDTGDLSEGSNLYYTTTRANSAIDTRVNKAFVDALNVDADTLDGYDSTAFPRLAANNTFTGSTQYITATGAPASLRMTGQGTSYAAASILLANDSGGDRAAGIYMYHRSAGDEWYMGQPYGGGNNDFIVSYVNQTNGNEQKTTASNGNAIFRITTAGVASLDGNRILTVADEGAGNGLDADTLDGQHGAYYLDWTNVTNKPDPVITLGGDLTGSVTLTDLGSGTLTATVVDDSHNHIISNVDGLQSALDAKLASSSYTAADVLTKIKTVDGSGSGLDADLLDGLDSTYFRNASNLNAGTIGLDYIPQQLRRSGNTGQTDWNSATSTQYGFGGLILGNATNGPGPSNYYHPWNVLYSSSSNQFQMALPYGDTGSITAGLYYRGYYSGAWTAWNTIWSSSNDGSGSGLDADTLDGSHRDTAYDSYTGGNIPFRSPGGYIFSEFFNITGAATALVATGIAVETGDDGFTRWQTPEQFIGNHNIWTSVNDGAASGLDADLLDGQQGSYYAAASSLSNYLPLAGGTVTGELHTSSGVLGVNGTSPALILWETDAPTNADYSRLVHSGGDLYIQSEGDILFTGYNGVNVTSLQVRVADAYHDIYHENNLTKAVIDALNVDADTLDGINSGSFLRSDQSDKILLNNDSQYAYMQMNASSSTTNAGYISFHSPDDTRRGYIGWGNGNYSVIYGENGYGWRFNGSEEVLFDAPSKFTGALSLPIDTWIDDENAADRLYLGSGSSTIFASPGGYLFRKTDNATNNVIIDDTGLGVGSSPSYKFQVSQTGSDVTALFQNTGTAGSSDSYLYISGSAAGGEGTEIATGFLFGDAGGATGGSYYYLHAPTDYHAWTMPGTGIRMLLDNDKFQIYNRLLINSGTEIPPDSSANGHIKIQSAGYAGYITLDGTGMHIGGNSAIRTTTLDVNETTVLSLSTSTATLFGNAILTTADEGAGNGLDADTVDGYQASNLAKLAIGNTFSAGQLISTGTGVQPYLDILQSGTVGTDYPEIRLRTGSRYDRMRNTGSGWVFSYNYTGAEKIMTYTGTALTIDGNTVLTTADEGSGNGLDADTVDGIQGSDIVRKGTASVISTDSIALYVNSATNTYSFATGYNSQYGYLGSDSTTFRISKDATNYLGVKATGITWNSGTTLPVLNGMSVDGTVVVKGASASVSNVVCFDTTSGNDWVKMGVYADRHFQMYWEDKTSNGGSPPYFSTDMLDIDPQGATSIYYAGSAKIATQSAGALCTGTMSATVNFTVTSDFKLKDIIGNSDRTAFIDQLKVYDFTWKDTGKKSVGVIAQEVQEYAPEFIHELDDGTLSVDYAKLAIAGLHEEKKKRENAEARIDELEDRLAALEAMIATLVDNK